MLIACAFSVRCSSVPETSSSPAESCASCGFRAPDQSERVNVDFLEAVKRHILNRLQMRERPNITHPLPKAAMVTALRRLHAGKVREDGRVEIPSFDGQASFNNEVHTETSEIISFAESGRILIHYSSRHLEEMCPASSRNWHCMKSINLFSNTQTIVREKINALHLSFNEKCHGNVVKSTPLHNFVLMCYFFRHSFTTSHLLTNLKIQI